MQLGEVLAYTNSRDEQGSAKVLMVPTLEAGQTMGAHMRVEVVTTPHPSVGLLLESGSVLNHQLNLKLELCSWSY